MTETLLSAFLVLVGVALGWQLCRAWDDAERKRDGDRLRKELEKLGIDYWE